MPTSSSFLSWLRVPLLLALLAVAGCAYAYFAGEAATLPVRLVPHLSPVPVVLDSVAVGLAWLPLPLNGYAVALTHDVAGPYTHPTAAALWLLLLAAVVAGWLAVVSGLARTPFLVGTGPVIFLLLSLNVDGLGLFEGSRPYFLWLSLGLLGSGAFGLHLLGERARPWQRALLMSALVATLVAVVALKSPLPLPDAALQLAAETVPAGAVLLALLVLWVGIENVRALLWFNTQAERPEQRFGLLPFVAASLLYVGALALYWFNGNELALGNGLHLDPLVLLLPAVATSGLGLRLRAPSYAAWLPYAAARALLALLVAGAAGALGYALYTAQAPLLDAAREYSALLLGLLGAAFLLYVLVNFGPLLSQRLRVYRVVFEPRRLPLYAVYVLALGGLVVYEVRTAWPLLDQVQAGRYNLLGDATRQQSEANPSDLATALLAERYYAESGDVLDRYNRPAQLGRAALYRFRAQIQNEQNALRRALRRHPDDEKLSLRLAAQLSSPADFLDALEVLRQARRQHPRSFALASDLAQLFTRSSLTDSVVHYLGQAERLAPTSPVGEANQLGLLLREGAYPAARKVVAAAKAPAGIPALAANEALLSLLPASRGKQVAPTQATPPAPADLDDATFAERYQQALQVVRSSPTPARLAWAAALGRLGTRPANEPYYEQLLYLQSLLLHAVGQEVAARQGLAPLTAGTSPSAAYYQYVRGLWQLQQGQYATAARQLGLAATHGQPLAAAAQGWAWRYAAQPDSARAVAQRLLASPDPPQRASGRQLLTALASPGPPAASQRPLVGAALLAQARQAEAQPAQAGRLYRQLLAEAPFNEAAVLATARFYTAQHRPTDAYEALRQGLLENPDSMPLLQAFVLAAADTGLADLAQPALQQLRQALRLDPAGYAALQAQFEARRKAHAAQVAGFEGPAAPPS